MRGVAVAVHVADGGSEAVQTLDDLVVLVHHLHVVVAADAAGSCEEPRRAFDSVERAVLDREQQFFALAELFVDSLVAVSVVSLNGFERLLLRQTQLLYQLLDGVGFDHLHLDVARAVHVDGSRTVDGGLPVGAHVVGRLEHFGAVHVAVVLPLRLVRIIIVPDGICVVALLVG